MGATKYVDVLRETKTSDVVSWSAGAIVGWSLAGWHPPAPWWRADGIRRRIGMRHVPLADLLNGFTTAGPSLTRAVEPGDEPIPWQLALHAVKRPGS